MTNCAFFSDYIFPVTLLCCKKQDYVVTEPLLYSFFNKIYATYLPKIHCITTAASLPSKQGSNTHYTMQGRLEELSNQSCCFWTIHTPCHNSLLDLVYLLIEQEEKNILCSAHPVSSSSSSWSLLHYLLARYYQDMTAFLPSKQGISLGPILAPVTQCKVIQGSPPLDLATWFLVTTVCGALQNRSSSVLE